MVYVKEFKIDSPNVKYTEDAIYSTYEYNTTEVKIEDENRAIAKPVKQVYEFKTSTKLPKVGVMLVGWGGNNGSTLTAGVLANKHKLHWETKEGIQHSNYLGSVTQASTSYLGVHNQDQVFAPLKNFLPMIEPENIVFGGWDISKMDLADAVRRSQVFDINLQKQLYPLLKDMVPLPGIYDADFIAKNQGTRADNIIKGNKQDQVDKIRGHIRDFRSTNQLETVIVLWSGNTERYSDISAGLNDSAENLMQSISKNVSEISPSTLYGVAATLEGVPYINASPQNTMVPGLVELAMRNNTMIGGDDLKSGQTKIKSVLVDFLVNSGIKPRSIVSYNHLGNNDGENLSAEQQFKSKEITKKGVVEDMVESNGILYEDLKKDRDRIDHVIVIKYVPFVQDSKRAIDEYISEIFMNGRHQLVIHNTCEDSLLAAPMLLDLIILAELCTRIKLKRDSESEFHSFHPICTVLSYYSKHPIVPAGTPLVNALNKQRALIENLIKACVGLPPDNNLLLEFK